jgi:predicted O-methyltransferase YrrM
MEGWLLALAERTPGFISRDEGLLLYRTGLEAAPAGPMLELGSYCGRSSIFLGAAAAERSSLLYSVDHHRGSEEHQPGEGYHDPSLVDAAGRVDTLPRFRRAIADSGLEGTVVAVVGDARLVARNWSTPVSLLFVDGGHSDSATWADYLGWVPHLRAEGFLAIHDVYPDLSDGNGRAPLHVYERALAEGWREEAAEGSLRILRR